MMFRVKDLDESIQYYTEAMGMKLIRKKDNEKVGRQSVHSLHRCGDKEDCSFVQFPLFDFHSGI